MTLAVEGKGEASVPSMILMHSVPPSGPDEVRVMVQLSESWSITGEMQSVSQRGLTRVDTNSNLNKQEQIRDWSEQKRSAPKTLFCRCLAPFYGTAESDFWVLYRLD